MFRLSSRTLAAVLARDIVDAAAQLNALLDVSRRAHPASPDEIKMFLHNKVSPVLASTELDRRGDSRDLRQLLGQLTRDAAFASLIVRARPNSPFVTSIATCIKEDQHRMRFVHKMTSPQASKLIDYLCRIGVTDEEVYPLLISRLNFGSLTELSRAMFALSEAHLHTMNMLVLLPLYCGEKWTLEFAPTKGLSEKSRRQTCNVFEAVRVLRAMSKSCRVTTEAARQDSTAAAVPSESVHLMRNKLLEFMFANATVLRGAHWLNVARALLNFPSELSELRDFSAAYPAIEEEVRACSAQAASPSTPRGAPCLVNCDAVAAVAIARVFQYAERRAPLPAADASHPITRDYPFDLSLMDLVKLLPLLDQFPQAAVHAATQERMESVLRVLTTRLAKLQLRDLVMALQVLRRAQSTAATRAAVATIATEAGRRLGAPASADVLGDVSFRTVALLAAALAALRVERCDGFVAYLSANTAAFPRALAADTVLSFVNALAAMARAMPRTSASHPALRELLACLLRFYQRHQAEGPLLELYPIEVARILRGCVLLDYVPTAPVLEGLLGSAAKPLRINAAVHEAGGTLVFDLSRTLAHFAKDFRAADTVEREQNLWLNGVQHSVMPLAAACTDATARALERNRVMPPSSSHAAVVWRTTLEMLGVFVDVQLESVPCHTMACRLRDIFAEVEALLRGAAAATAAHLARCTHHVHHPDEAVRRARQTNFGANCNLHYLSALLMFEYLVYHGSSQAARQRGSRNRATAVAAVAGETDAALASADATAPAEVDDDCATLADLKERYRVFLNTPIADGAPHTPMSVVQHIFACPLSGPAAAKSGVAGVTLLSKRETVEITTALPFALPLVMEPGPVNEFFTEQCITIMVGDAAEPLAGESDDAAHS